MTPQLASLLALIGLVIAILTACIAGETLIRRIENRSASRLGDPTPTQAERIRQALGDDLMAIIDATREPLISDRIDQLILESRRCSDPPCCFEDNFVCRGHFRQVTDAAATEFNAAEWEAKLK